jgi:hypothetical protein
MLPSRKLIFSAYSDLPYKTFAVEEQTFYFRWHMLHFFLSNSYEISVIVYFKTSLTLYLDLLVKRVGYLARRPSRLCITTRRTINEWYPSQASSFKPLTYYSYCYYGVDCKFAKKYIKKWVRLHFRRVILIIVGVSVSPNGHRGNNFE